MTELRSATTGLDWLAEFERDRGRPLRVLHLGNIANNAYNNAKIQRRRGIHADVSCPNYFHIMACPEWEDAEFRGDVVDELFPDWWNVELGAFERPEWFAQGNWQTCQRYFLARSQSRGAHAAFLRRRLTIERWLWCRSTLLARTLGYRGGAASWSRLLRSIARVAFRKARHTARAVTLLARGHGVRKALVTLFPSRLARLEPGSAVDTTPLGARFSMRFPERPPLGRHDLRGYREQAGGWREVLAHYDVVQGYSIDAIVALICGAKTWGAYEHGTLRELPFEDTPTGRICALVYSEAPVVFVTNSDVLPSAERLGIDQSRLTLLPHAVDSDRLFEFANAHAELLPRPGGPITFYGPSRQDWVDRDVSWSKGNDLFLRAAASLRDRFEFRVVLAEWGRDLDASRRLITELGLDDFVEWIPALRKRDLWARFLSSHAVVDQFTIAAIGGVAFEAMALGCRVITALDTEEAGGFFGQTPPLFAARTEGEIAAALEEILRDPEDGAGRGAAARAWFAEYHSADRIVELQATAYRRLLDSGQAISSPSQPRIEQA